MNADCENEKKNKKINKHMMHLDASNLHGVEMLRYLQKTEFEICVCFFIYFTKSKHLQIMTNIYNITKKPPFVLDIFKFLYFLLLLFYTPLAIFKFMEKLTEDKS